MLSVTSPTLSPVVTPRPRCSVTTLSGSGCDPLHRNVETDTSPGSGRIGDRGEGGGKVMVTRTPAAGLRLRPAPAPAHSTLVSRRSEQRESRDWVCIVHTLPGSRCDPPHTHSTSNSHCDHASPSVTSNLCCGDGEVNTKQDLKVSS